MIMQCNNTSIKLDQQWGHRMDGSCEMKPETLYTVNTSLRSELREKEEHSGGFWMSVVDKVHEGCRCVKEREMSAVEWGSWLAEQSVLEDWPWVWCSVAQCGLNTVIQAQPELASCRTKRISSFCCGVHLEKSRGPEAACGTRPVTAVSCQPSEDEMLIWIERWC